MPNWLSWHPIRLPRERHIAEWENVLREGHVKTIGAREQERVLRRHLQLHLYILVLVHHYRWLLLLLNACLIRLSALLRCLLGRLERSLLVLGEVGRGEVGLKGRGHEHIAWVW